MKLGVITIQRINNYGAELQAFALQRKLNLLGHDCENIDYLFYKHPEHQATPLSAPLTPLCWKNRTKEFLYPRLQRFSAAFHLHDAAARLARFEAFHRDHTRMTAKTYRTVDKLYDESFDYDAYIVGSDQVWNPRANTSLAPYFLTFSPEGKRRISYASSFGVDQLPAAFSETCKNFLRSFDFLSVRENSGVNLIRDLLGREAELVLDPTLLLSRSEWEAVAVSPPAGKPYVLLYDLLPSAPAVNLAQSMATGLGSGRVVCLCRGAGVRQLAGIEHARDAGPAEFVGLFQHAHAVVTNSFHGTAFSILFRKPFYAVIPSRMRNAGRIQSVLETSALLPRMVFEEDTPSQPDLTCEYSEAQQRLAAAQEKSVHFLLHALEST